MAVDENLAARIRHALTRKRGVEGKGMFGGVGFLRNGNMVVGGWKDSLIVRLGPDTFDDALLGPHVRKADITVTPMKESVPVEPGGVEADDRLSVWIQRTIEFVAKLRKQ